MGDYPWKTRNFYNRRFPKGFDGFSDEEMTTIHIRQGDSEETHDFISIPGKEWTIERMTYHLIRDLSKGWRIELLYYNGINYERNDKGFWDFHEPGKNNGSSFYIYNPHTGFREEEEEFEPFPWEED